MEYVCYLNVVDRMLGKDVNLFGDGTKVEDGIEFDKTNRCLGCSRHMSPDNSPLYLAVLVEGVQVVSCEVVED